MHRSGTSALCAALAACGASFSEGLIDAIAGVNDEGFWEDEALVELNEQLLGLTESTWYAPSSRLGAVDWCDSRFTQLRRRGLQVLSTGFGDAKLQAVKDPRLCLTLPFWMSLCSELEIPFRVCVASRSPLEVARSLLRRDGFPLGYGLRLCAGYREQLDQAVPADALFVSYASLLENAPAVMESLARELPLEPDPEKLGVAVSPSLRHHAEGATDDPLGTGDYRAFSLTDLRRAIDERYPQDETLREFARSLVFRGRELAKTGAAHSRALATLDERDADIAALSAEHRKALAMVDERDADIARLSDEHRTALATIDERDEQIREFDRRLAKIGEEHSHALEVIRERDAQVALLQQRLEYIYNLPGVGFVIRRMRKNARG